MEYILKDNLLRKNSYLYQIAELKSITLNRLKFKYMKEKIATTLACFCLSIVLSIAAIAQTITVSGKITDSNGEVLVGATVVEVGTHNGTAADIDGKYKLTVSKGAMLEFAYIGFKTQTIKATSETLDVVMQEDAKILEDVVVVGYAIERKEVFTGAASRIESSDIKPARTKRQIRTEPLKRQDGEKYTKIKPNEFIKVSSEPLSTFSADVDKASYSNIRSYINGGEIPPTDAIRIEEMINYFKYDYEAPTNGEPVKFHTEIGACPWNEKSRLVKIGLKAREKGLQKNTKKEELPKTSLVFLIDVSGSMSGDNRIGLVKSSMKMLLDQLRPDDRVAIVTYASGTQVKLKSTPVSKKDQIIEVLDNLFAGGSTSGSAGIQLAYETAEEAFIKGGNNRVILCTDGDFNVGISDPDELKKLIEEKRKSGVFLSVFGYGMYNYRDDIMQTLSKAGNGNYAYINNLMEANSVMVDQFLGTIYTVAKDVKLQVEFNPLKVDSYRLLGYELRKLNKEDFNDDTKDAGEMGIGHTVTAFYEIIPAGADADDKPKKKDKKKEQRPVVDPLKYQTSTLTGSDELLTVKMRYKDPLDENSKMVSAVLNDKAGDEVSSDFRFAAAVARFGLLLRDGKKMKAKDLDDIIDIASANYGEDKDGYRREFVRLVKLTKDVSKAK